MDVKNFIAQYRTVLLYIAGGVVVAGVASAAIIFTNNGTLFKGETLFYQVLCSASPAQADPDQQITVTASAIGYSPTSWSWSSDKDGYIGGGNPITKSYPPGTGTITFTVSGITRYPNGDIKDNYSGSCTASIKSMSNVFSSPTIVQSTTDNLQDADIPSLKDVVEVIPGAEQVDASPPTDALFVPTAPSNLQATGVSSSRIDVTWTDNSDNETAFELGKYAGGMWLTTQIGTNKTSYSYTGLEPGKSYTFKVRAKNNSGDSAWSGEVSASTTAATVACQSFTYSGWSVCSNSGTQTRTVISSSPPGCSGGVEPVLSQSCAPEPPQICQPGQQQQTACGDGVNYKSRTCNSAGTAWGNWSDCPAQTQTQSDQQSSQDQSGQQQSQAGQTSGQGQQAASQQGTTGQGAQTSQQATSGQAAQTAAAAQEAAPAPEAPPEPSKCPGVNYPKDINENWARDLIRQAYDLCLVKGYDDGTFKPDQPVTRAEAVKMVLAAAGIPPVQGCYDSDCGSPFADLDMWQGQWLRAAWNLQIVKGVGPGRFAPNRGMSRAEAAVVVANAFKIPAFQGCYTANCGAGHPNNFFLDITEKWQGPYVRALYDKGLVSGPFPNKFEPDRPINRAELTKLILKAKETAVP